VDIVEELATVQTKVKVSTTAGDVGALTTLGNLPAPIRGRQIRRKVVVHLDQFAPFQRTTWDEWP
jgi:hypothetical protein